MIDSEGYRANIGIVITNEKKQILLAKRYKQDAWQLPQGGIDKGETELEAHYSKNLLDIVIFGCEKMLLTLQHLKSIRMNMQLC